jgi:hypothetical protein
VPATLEPSTSAALEFLKSLPAGSIVAQLDDGSVKVCNDLAEADRLIEESRIHSAPQSASQRITKRARANGARTQVQ